MIYIGIILLTLFDVVLTVFGVNEGFVEEANPIWRSMFEWNPFVIGFVILVLVGVLFTIIFLNRRIKWVKPVMVGLLVIKVVVMLFHANWISKIGEIL